MEDSKHKVSGNPNKNLLICRYEVDGPLHCIFLNPGKLLIIDVLRYVYLTYNDLVGYLSGPIS